MDYQNQIVPASLAGGVGATLTNGGETNHQGVELGVRGDTISPFREGDRLFARMAYTLLPAASFAGTRLSSVPGFSNVSVSGNRLPYAPEHSGSLVTGYRFGARGDVFAELVYVSSQFADDLNTTVSTADGQRGILEPAATWNAGVNVYVLGNRLQAFAVAYNLGNALNIVDRSRGIVPSPPRRMQAGLRLAF